MMRGSSIFLICGLSLNSAAAAAQTDWAAHVRTAFDRHLEICAPALGDPSGFIEAMPSLFAVGTHGIRSSPDGRIFRAYISTDGGRFSTHYSRYLVGDVGWENCVTYFQDPSTFDVASEVLAEAYVTVAVSLLGAENVVGGRMPELAASYGGGSDLLEENLDSFEFALSGLIEGDDVMTVSHVIGGYISLASQRPLFREQAASVVDTTRQDFADHCFSPLLTADSAAANLPARHDFYDLDPFSAGNPISEPSGRPATPGTDRRCEVAFDGEEVDASVEVVIAALASEGILTAADVPQDFDQQEGTQFISARRLNPRRVAVVQVGTRPGPNGVETFLNVERLVPEAAP